MEKPLRIDKNKLFICKYFTVLRKSTFEKLKAAQKQAKNRKSTFANTCLFFQEQNFSWNGSLGKFAFGNYLNAYLLSKVLNVNHLCFTVLFLII